MNTRAGVVITPEYLPALLILVIVTALTAAPSAQAAETCAGCHPEMASQPWSLPAMPPADVLRAQTTACFQYGRVLEEWYYIDELFATTERHLVQLKQDRFHVEPLVEQLGDVRNLYRVSMSKPVMSLSEFQQRTGKLRFEAGKIYRIAKERRIDQDGRHIFGFVVIGTLLLLFMVVTGWRVASGSGEVNPRKTTLGYDDLQQRNAEPVKEVAE